MEQLREEVKLQGGLDKVEQRWEWRRIALAMNAPPHYGFCILRRQFMAATTERETSKKAENAVHGSGLLQCT